MSFAFGHLIGAYLLGVIIQKTSKKKIPNLGWGLLLLGGIIPDIDFLFDWALNTHIHRSFTHSLLFVIVMYFVLFFILKNYKNQELAKYFSFGILTHIFLDMITGLYGVMLFYPLNFWVSFYGVGTTPNPLPFFNLNIISWAIFDMGLGVIWLGYLFIKGKLKFN